jgi:hypothetical protein
MTRMQRDHQRLAGAIWKNAQLFGRKASSIDPVCWTAEQLGTRGIPSRERDE